MLLSHSLASQEMASLYSPHWLLSVSKSMYQWMGHHFHGGGSEPLTAHTLSRSQLVAERPSTLMSPPVKKAKGLSWISCASEMRSAAIGLSQLWHTIRCHAERGSTLRHAFVSKLRVGIGQNQPCLAADTGLFFRSLATQETRSPARRPQQTYRQPPACTRVKGSSGPTSRQGFEGAFCTRQGQPSCRNAFSHLLGLSKLMGWHPQSESVCRGTLQGKLVRIKDEF